MTWEEWVNSSYNTGYFKKPSLGDVPIHNSDGNKYISEEEDGFPIFSGELIIPLHNYLLFTL